MPQLNRVHLSDLHAVARIALDAGAGVTDVVERMHRTVQRGPLPLGRATRESTRGLTGFVYRCVRGGFKLAARGMESLEPWGGVPDEHDSTPGRDAFVAIVNGVYGDYLARTNNPLAMQMSVRLRGRRVDPANPASALAGEAAGAPGGRLLLLMHGLCMNDRQWTRNGHDHGAALAAAAGFTPLYLRYNSGLHVTANGRQLARLLEQLVTNWPVPVEELAIVGHSMGGLVARSAVHHASRARRRWPKRLTKLVFLGTPHHGAPLERGGRRLEYVMDLSPYSAPILGISQRSVGIGDLATGSITRRAGEVVPLPRGVKCFAVGATHAKRGGLIAERLWGDGLVPLDSALGRHPDARRALDIPKSRQWVGYGMGHLDLLEKPQVYAQLEHWLSER